MVIVAQLWVVAQGLRIFWPTLVASNVSGSLKLKYVYITKSEGLYITVKDTADADLA